MVPIIVYLVGEKNHKILVKTEMALYMQIKDYSAFMYVGLPNQVPLACKGTVKLVFVSGKTSPN